MPEVLPHYNVHISNPEMKLSAGITSEHVEHFEGQMLPHLFW